VIDLKVLVDENVAKAGPASKTLGEVGGQLARLLEDGERVSIHLRRWEAPIGAESFEICEYGSEPGEEELRKLFPMIPEPRR